MILAHFLTNHDIHIMFLGECFIVGQYIAPAPIFSICFSPFAGTSGVRFNAKLIVGFIVVIFIQVIVGRKFCF